MCSAPASPSAPSPEPTLGVCTDLRSSTSIHCSLGRSGHALLQCPLQWALSAAPSTRCGFLVGLPTSTCTHTFIPTDGSARATATPLGGGELRDAAAQTTCAHSGLASDAHVAWANPRAFPRPWPQAPPTRNLRIQLPRPASLPGGRISPQAPCADGSLSLSCPPPPACGGVCSIHPLLSLHADPTPPFHSLRPIPP